MSYQTSAMYLLGVNYLQYLTISW